MKSRQWASSSLRIWLMRPGLQPSSLANSEVCSPLARARATCRDGRCERVTLDGVASFVEALDVPLDVPGHGQITVDVAYGGCYYVLVDAAALGLHLTRGAARDVVEAATAVSVAARADIKVRHPDVPEIDFISYVMVTGDDDPAAGRLRGATVLSGRVDRSPCGTGNSARLACWINSPVRRQSDIRRDRACISRRHKTTTGRGETLAGGGTATRATNFNLVAALRTPATVSVSGSMKSNETTAAPAKTMSGSAM